MKQAPIARKPETIYLVFGMRLRVVREALGVTQDELAKRIKLSRATIANIETGRQRVLLHTANEIAHTLGTNLRNMLRGS